MEDLSIILNTILQKNQHNEVLLHYQAILITGKSVIILSFFPVIILKANKIKRHHKYFWKFMMFTSGFKVVLLRINSKNGISFL